MNVEAGIAANETMTLESHYTLYRTHATHKILPSLFSPFGET